MEEGEMRKHGLFLIFFILGSIVFPQNFDVYLAHLDFYTKADVVRSRDSTQIWDWLKSHASAREDCFAYVAWCDSDGNFFSDVSTSKNVSDQDFWKAIFLENKDNFVSESTYSDDAMENVIYVCQSAKAFGSTVEFDGEKIHSIEFGCTKFKHFFNFGHTKFKCAIGIRNICNDRRKRRKRI